MRAHTHTHTHRGMSHQGPKAGNPLIKELLSQTLFVFKLDILDVMIQLLWVYVCMCMCNAFVKMPKYVAGLMLEIFCIR